MAFKRRSFRHTYINLLLLIIFLLMMSACGSTPAEATPDTNPIVGVIPTEPQEPVQIITDTAAPEPEPTAVINTETAIKSTATAAEPAQAAINPLTGLAVSDPESLDLPPALVAMSNFPVSLRPQSGLSAASIVYEFYIGEGMTRLLAFFLGDLGDIKIGPVHTGRLPDESLRQLHQGFLVNSGGSGNVTRNLYHETTLHAKTETEIGKIMISGDELTAVAENEKETLDKMGPGGMKFDPAIPEDGKKADSFWLMYSYPNQIIWRYDKTSGGYQRYQDKGDAVTFEQINDRLTDEPLVYENVIIMFTEHYAKYETLIDLYFTFYDKEPAFLLRDGQMYKIYWSTRNTQAERESGKSKPIRFIDYDGDLFPLKPGQTWIEIVQPGTPTWESIDSEIYYDRVNKKEKGSGHWSMIYEPPQPILDTP